MKIKVLLSALALSVLSYSYSYSETIATTSNNAATNGTTWSMDTVLPKQSGLEVNGIIYSYSVLKEIEDALKVYVQNERANGEGYVFRQEDDWTGVPGNTIRRNIPLPPTPTEEWGMGSITTEGIGSITDPNVQYSYQFDPCYVVLANPQCPGYEQALLEYLKDKGLLSDEVDTQDQFLNDYVTSLLETDLTVVEEKEEETEEDSNEEDSLEDRLRIVDSANEIASSAEQNAIMAALNNNVIDTYYTVTIQGGVYNDALKFEQKEISDNNKAAARVGLAQQKLHNDMVDMQYNR